MARRTKHYRSGKNAKTRRTRKTSSYWMVTALVLVCLGLLSGLAGWFHHRPSNHPSGKSNVQSAPSRVSTEGIAPSEPTKASATGETQPVDVEKSANLLNEGVELLSRGKVNDALARFQEAVKLNPEDEDAHYNLALALARKGDRKAAQKQYLEALRIYPDYAEVHNSFGNLLVAEGKLGEAIEHFQSAIKLAPDDASTRNNLGTALGLQGKVVESISCFREAVLL